jgi:hypothetical protein
MATREKLKREEESDESKGQGEDEGDREEVYAPCSPMR